MLLATITWTLNVAAMISADYWCPLCGLHPKIILRWGFDPEIVRMA